MGPDLPHVPLGDPRIHWVHSFDELVGVVLSASQNAACWLRELAMGDFDALARTLRVEGDMATIDEGALQLARASVGLAPAVDALLADLERLRGAGHAPEISCIARSTRDPDPVLPTDVHSFHVDSANAPTETFLCSYNGAATEGLHLADAQRAVEVPAIRARLLEAFGGTDGDAFRAFLRECHYDLHFVPRPDARPFSLGVGNLWRLGVERPGSPVPGFIHRAPIARGPVPRLLMIS